MQGLQHAVKAHVGERHTGRDKAREQRSVRIVLSAERYEGPYHDGISVNKNGELKHAELFLEVFVRSLRENGGGLKSAPVTVIDPVGSRPLPSELKERLSTKHDIEFVDLFDGDDSSARVDMYDPKVRACAWAESSYEEDIILFMDYDIAFGDGEHMWRIVQALEPGHAILTETRSWTIEPEVLDKYDIKAPNKFLSCVVGAFRSDGLFAEWERRFAELKQTLDLTKVEKSLEEYALMVAVDKKGTSLVDYMTSDDRFSARLDYWKRACDPTYHYVSLDGLRHYAENNGKSLRWVVTEHIEPLKYDIEKYSKTRERLREISSSRYSTKEAMTNVLKSCAKPFTRSHTRDSVNE